MAEYYPLADSYHPRPDRFVSRLLPPNWRRACSLKYVGAQRLCLEK
jgi:hypothetical protein